MGVVIARLVFLAFVALTGTIIYNALYLQDQHGPAAISASQPPKVIATTTSSPPESAAPAVPIGPVETAKLPPVSTDLPSPPPVAEGGTPELLIKAVQRELSTRGYDVGPADGKLNDKTRAAISAYEGREGLPITGKASDDLLRHILLGDSVRPATATTGSVQPGAAAPPKAKSDAADSSVKAVQQVLADLGYAPGPVDGAMGASTTQAITAFQHDRKIRETGRITPELLRELKRVTGRDLTKTAAAP
jgi:peptidoglycan hydrolase-like protein with peptidoglycan-binding domain